jgi:hypothetical protein
MSPYKRCMATIEGRIADRVPAYTPSIACDVASKILGREAHHWIIEKIGCSLMAKGRSMRARFRADSNTAMSIS